jgi:PHAX RNA-binding domain
MDTLTAEKLAAALQEPDKALLARVLTILGQERCAAILADTLTIESQGGMLTKAGYRRRTPGGVFFHLVKDRSTGKERHGLFAIPRATKRRKQTTPSTTPATAAPPVSLTLNLWKGLQPMPVTATLKLVLRDLPETRERDGLVYMALTNEPKGLPKGISLDSGPLYLTSPVKQWRTACTKAEQIRASGTPALLIVEAHVSTREGALVGVVKGVQVVEGKAPVQPPG